MAIKVKHEGNVTSRVYASAAGGKGKRQAEDAKVLASMQRGGMGGGGGGTGGGARAGGSAPTLSAPTSHAALGSTGSLIGRSNTFAQQQELQKQQDDAILTRQKNDQEWKTGENEKDRDWRTAEAQKDREFRIGLQRSEQEWQQNQQLDKERREMRREDLRRKGYSEEAILRIEENTRKKESIESDPKLTPEQKAAALEELRKEREGIVPSYEATPDPNDPAQSIREVTLPDGRKVQMMRDARGNWTEYVPDRSKMTAEEIWDSSFVAPDGTRWISDGRGGLTPLESRSQYAGQNQTLKREQKAWDNYQKFVDKKLEEKYERSQDKDAPDEEKIFDRQKIIEEAKKEYEAIHGFVPVDPNTNPTSTSTPASTPTKDGAQSSSDEKKKTKWGLFAR